MARRVVEIISNSQADRAGNTFREIVARELEAGRRLPPRVRADRDALRSAIDVITKYRAMHEYPQTKVTLGVRQMISTELGAAGPRPAQRFKRMPRILMKLQRFPHMRLSQMEDIGGCRAIFQSLADLRAVERRILRRWPQARVTDYIAHPKPDGYRCLHIVEKRDGRLVEVQLRTVLQHMWAESIEAWSTLVTWDLKDGDGPADLREYFRMAAERLAREDAGLDRDPVLEQDFDTVREQVRHYFVRN